MTDCLTGCEIKPESDPRQLRIHVFALPGTPQTLSRVLESRGGVSGEIDETRQTLSRILESRRGVSGEVDKDGMGFGPSVAHPNDQCIRSASRLGSGGPHAHRRCSTPERLPDQ